MKTIYSLLLILFTLNVSAQLDPTKVKREIFEAKIKGLAEDFNLVFKLRTCSLIDNREYEYVGLVGYYLFSPKVDVVDYSYKFEIIPWPKEKPYWHYYLLKRIGNKMYNTWTDDTLEVNIPCNKYYPFDDEFLIKFDTITDNYYFVSGNFFLDRMSKIYPTSALHRLARKTAELRAAQYGVTPPVIRHKETEDYYEFLGKGSYLTENLLIRVPKTTRHKIGQTWEMLYFTNSKEIEGNERGLFYEVKYTRTANPTSTDELFPKYRKLNIDEVISTGKNYYIFIDYLKSASQGFTLLIYKLLSINLFHLNLNSEALTISTLKANLRI